MSNIQFEKRAVAFIDVLGFKSVVNAAEQCQGKLDELGQLITLLEGAVPKLDNSVDQRIPKELIPMHIYISDSIILSAPLTSSTHPGYRGLSILVMRVIQISHLLLAKGYLIRGGISVGSVWHSDSNVTFRHNSVNIQPRSCLIPFIIKRTGVNHGKASQHIRRSCSSF